MPHAILAQELTNPAASAATPAVVTQRQRTVEALAVLQSVIDLAFDATLLLDEQTLMQIAPLAAERMRVRAIFRPGKVDDLPDVRTVLRFSDPAFHPETQSDRRAA